MADDVRDALINRRIPAAIRTNNPGAMWPGPSATRFGAVGHQNLADGNKIAVFSDPVSGAAAHFDLFARKYTGQPLEAAVRRWSGGNSSGVYTNKVAAALGVAPDAVITTDMLKGPQGLTLAKAMAQHEAGRAYPLSDEQWAAAQARAFGSGSAPEASRAAMASTPMPAVNRDQSPAPMGGGQSSETMTGAAGDDPMLPESPSKLKQALAQSMLQSGMAAQPKNWGELVSGLGDLYMGTKLAGDSERENKAYSGAVARAIADATTPSDLTRILSATGNPDHQKLALQMKISSMGPKDEKTNAEIAKLNAETAKLQTEAQQGALGKAPEGFRVKMANGAPVLDDTGRPVVEPIPGGPKEALGAEVGARLGMSKSFLDDFGAIRKEIEQGGLSDWSGGLASGAFGVGQTGDIQRRIKTGSDALLRNLTGAGMPQQEAERYIQRYEPQLTDSRATVLSKLDRLGREVWNTTETVTRGHGGVPKGFARPDVAFGAQQGQAQPQAQAPQSGSPYAGMSNEEFLSMRGRSVGSIQQGSELPASVQNDPDVSAMASYLKQPQQEDAQLDRMLQPTQNDISALLSQSGNPAALRQFEAKFGLQPGGALALLQQYAQGLGR